ncbi:MAG TPA: adenylosuccinate lyase, partial [Solirubrobacterales bacterium]|nr:adenylosuccinate lyase [Solirubrobacterales bacterium]
ARRPHHQLLMIPRYTRPEIGAVWTPQAKMESWLEVELAATEAWAEEGVVPREAAEAARANAEFTVEAVNEREKITDHDVAAFVDVVAASVGEHGRWIHYGLTSSDVLDTALALQLREAGEVVLAGARAYRDALIERALEHRDTLCVGRTHGVHAEPTTFGLRLAGFAFEADRNLDRLNDAFAQLAFGKLSGAVGTYASVPPAVEARVMERLGLQREDVATQVIPRDRHAILTSATAIAAAGLERFATEVRNLQRTEVREVEEPFASGKQKGSSAMPHKRNPIRTERITGLARVLRGYAQTGLENVALWHERDISHSGAERVILPDATIGLDYMQDLATKVVSGMTIRTDRMRENLNLTHGALFSQRALTALVESGLTRDEAYRIVQENAQQAWDSGTEFRELLGAAAPELDLDAVFDYSAYLTHLPEVFERLEALRD